MIKNYYISFLTDDIEFITAQDAAKITNAWNSGARFIVVNDNVYASHQIKAIKRVDRFKETAMFWDAKLITHANFSNEKIEALMQQFSIKNFFKKTHELQSKNPD